MTYVQQLPGKFDIADPTWPKYRFWPKQGVLTSDEFHEAGELVGARSDAALGGRPMVWEGQVGAWRKWRGVAEAQKTGAVGLKMTGADYALTAKIAALPTPGSSLVFGLRRDALPYRPSRKEVYLTLQGGGTLNLVNAGDSRVDLGTVSGAVQVGDKITFSVKGSTVSVAVNGAEKLSGTTDTTGPGFACVYTTADQLNQGAKLSNLQIDTL